MLRIRFTYHGNLIKYAQMKGQLFPFCESSQARKMVPELDAF